MQNAEHYVKQALDMFGRLDDNEGKAQAYRTLSSVYRYQYKFEEALKYLRNGIQLVAKSNSNRLLSSLYQFYGRTFRHYASYVQENVEHDSDNLNISEKAGLYSEALEALKESIVLAEKTGNQWESARSKLEIVLIRLLTQGTQNESELKGLLDQVWLTAVSLDDELLKGYVYENRARIEIQNKRFFEAGLAFGEAACYIAKRAGQETNRGFSRLHHVLLDSRLSVEHSVALAQGVYDQIQLIDHQNNTKLTALMKMCEQILDLPSSGSNQNEN